MSFIGLQTVPQPALASQASDWTPRIYLVEGNIAAGKTTLVNRLCEQHNLVPVPEPVEDNPYLEKFYKEPSKYALAMQLWLFERRLTAYREAVRVASTRGCNGVVLDRSVFSDYVFALNGYHEGTISRTGFDEYLRAYNEALRTLPAPTAVFYLNVSPERCLYRIRNVRGRECEQSIPLSYLQGLDSCYTTFLANMQGICPVVTLDWSEYGSAADVYGMMEAVPASPLAVSAAATVWAASE